MGKPNRVLEMFYLLLQGGKVSKKACAEQYGVSIRSVERDAATVREMLAESAPECSLNIDAEGSYYIDNLQQKAFTPMEVLFICKVLLSSRSLTKEEMSGVIHAMNSLFPFDIRHEIKSAIQNELEQYVGPLHDRKLLSLHWDLNRALERQLKVSLVYRKLSGEQVTRKVLPVSVVSSEYYLYLVGFFEEKAYKYPAFFRLDRIEEVAVTDEHYNPKLYADYNMGKMKQCIQFMYAGELMAVKLAVRHRALEAVRDRLPNSRVVSKSKERTTIKAKVFGEGFWRWALQYGDDIKVLEPIALRDKIAESAARILAMYAGE